MFKKLAVLVAVLLFAANAYAASFAFKACTADNKLVQLNIALADQAVSQDNTLAGRVNLAFALAADKLSAEALQSAEGFELFVSYLAQTNVDVTVIEGLSQPQVIADSCQ
jgi:hypothetical protein